MCGSRRFRARRDNGRSDDRIGVAISFGGSKLAVALVRMQDYAVVSRSDEVPWSVCASLSIDDAACSAVRLAVKLAGQLIAAHARDQIDCVGIAWPGPGEYSAGEVKATFVPGFQQALNLKAMLMTEFGRALGCHFRCPIIIRLDAAARAMGECRLSSGSFGPSRENRSGILVNIATGIAGAVVIDGHVLEEMAGYGRSYGQWGRYVFRDIESGTWFWKPTTDGSIGAHTPGRHVRLTEWCGAIALASRAAPVEEGGVPTGVSSCSRTGNSGVERRLLRDITIRAYAADPIAMRVVAEAGHDVGNALAVVRRQLREWIAGDQITIAGGIGEHFGRPDDSEQSDLFLDAIRDALPATRVERSAVGIDAEFVGAMP